MNFHCSEKPLAHQCDEALCELHTTRKSRSSWRYRYVSFGIISAVIVLYLLFSTIMAGDIFTKLRSSEDHPESVLSLEPFYFSGFTDGQCQMPAAKASQTTALSCTNGLKNIEYLKFQNGESKWTLCLYAQRNCAGPVRYISSNNPKCTKSPVTALSFKVGLNGRC